MNYAEYQVQMNGVTTLVDPTLNPQILLFRQTVPKGESFIIMSPNCSIPNKAREDLTFVAVAHARAFRCYDEVKPRDLVLTYPDSFITLHIEILKNAAQLRIPSNELSYELNRGNDTVPKIAALFNCTFEIATIRLQCADVSTMRKPNHQWQICQPERSPSERRRDLALSRQSKKSTK